MLSNQFHMAAEGFCFGQPLPTHCTMVSRFGAVLALLGALGTGCKVAGGVGSSDVLLRGYLSGRSYAPLWRESGLQGGHGQQGPSPCMANLLPCSLTFTKARNSGNQQW